MTKEEIQKRVEELKTTVKGFNVMISQGKYLEPEQIVEMNNAFTELDSLLFKLRSFEDGAQ